MSLRVWLPLTKDLRNQGLSSITPTQTSGFTKITTGKLGGCYKFTSVFDTLLPLSEWDWTTQSVSFGCWAKISKTELSALVEVPSYSSTYATMGGTLLGRLSYGGIGIRWQTNNIYIDSALNKLYVYTFIRNTNSQINQTNSQEVPFDTWFHIMTVIDRNDSQIKLYLNGELIKSTALTVTGTFATGTFRIAESTWHSGNGYSSSGCWQLNDIRIYDHALSPLEVKQISQGLILHYPLDRGGFGVSNILLNTHFDSRYIQSTGWDTSKNGTQLANSWGGYNGGVANQSTVYHAHLKEFNGEWVYEYIKTANESWLGISQGGLNSKLIAGKTYTFSWEQYCVSGNNYVQTGLYYFKTGATSANFHLGLIYGNVGRELGKWQKFSRTFIAPEDGDYSKNMSWYIYGHMGNGIVYVRHPKLEESFKATPWCPNSADELYNTLGLNNNIQYDTSGYENNGTKVGTFNYDSDTPKYNISTKIAASASGIKLTNFSIGNIWSMSVWFKYPSQDSSGWKALVILNNNGGDADLQFGNYINCSGNIIQYSANGKYTAGVTFTYGEWHHIVNTYDGTTLKCYLDGVYKTSLKPGQTLSRSNLGIGLKSSAVDFSSVSNSATNVFLSDVRIYATALSAQDVLSLYNNSAYIDNQGNIYGAVYEEV